MASSTRFLTLVSIFATLFTSSAFAQTFTSCNPLNGTCPADPALGTTHTFDFNASSSTSTWDTTAGSLGYSADDGMAFTIAKEGDSPTLVSQFYIFFGIVEIHMKAAPGTGIVSSVMLQSDDLDEIDWELIGGNNSYVQTNYFGKGNTTSYDRAQWVPINGAQDDYHNYTVHWTAQSIEWYVDSNLMRTLAYGDAVGGQNFPQTPMQVHLGIWSGGDPSKDSPGTVEWAGGETDFSKAPFSMYVKQARIQDFSTGSEYTYSDKTGAYTSIKATK
jgi:hypothetical protein